MTQKASMRTIPPEIALLPKVSLHDHLDGGVRLATLADIASAKGLPAPTTLRPSGRSLVEYLKPFSHVTSLVTSPDLLARITREALDDLEADNVVYAELRFAPLLHVSPDPDALDAAIAAVLDEMRAHQVTSRLIVCHLRGTEHDELAASGALRFAGRGVVGFDLAGDESISPHAHAKAIRTAHEGLALTLHAGEALGPDSIRESLSYSPERLGHGVRIIEAKSAEPALYKATSTRHLEVCPSSNIHTGVVSHLDHHPVHTLLDDGFSLSINTDNRTMSNTTLSNEISLLATADISLSMLADLQDAAARAAFDRAAAQAALASARSV